MLTACYMNECVPASCCDQRAPPVLHYLERRMTDGLLEVDVLVQPYWISQPKVGFECSLTSQSLRKFGDFSFSWSLISLDLLWFPSKSWSSIMQLFIHIARSPLKCWIWVLVHMLQPKLEWHFKELWPFFPSVCHWFPSICNDFYRIPLHS